MVPAMTDWYFVVEDIIVAVLGEEYFQRPVTKDEILTIAEAAEYNGLLEQACWWSVITMLATPAETARQVLEGNTHAGNLVNLIWNDERSVMTGAWLQHYMEAP